MAVQPKRKFSLDIVPGRNDICRFGPFESMHLDVSGFGHQVDIKLEDEDKSLNTPLVPGGKIFVDVYVMEEESAGDQGSDDGA